MNTSFSESIAQEAALAWPETLGLAVLHGPDIVVGEHTTERSDPKYHDVMLESCAFAALRDTLLPKLISGDLRIKDAERFAARTV